MKTPSLVALVATVLGMLVLAFVSAVKGDQPRQAPVSAQAPPEVDDRPKPVDPVKPKVSCGCSSGCTCGCNEGAECTCHSKTNTNKSGLDINNRQLRELNDRLNKMLDEVNAMLEKQQDINTHVNNTTRRQESSITLSGGIGSVPSTCCSLQPVQMQERYYSPPPTIYQQPVTYQPVYQQPAVAYQQPMNYGYRASYRPILSARGRSSSC